MCTGSPLSSKYDSNLAQLLQKLPKNAADREYCPTSVSVKTSGAGEISKILLKQNKAYLHFLLNFLNNFQRSFCA
jgi:predicted transposase YdaD